MPRPERGTREYENYKAAKRAHKAAKKLEREASSSESKSRQRSGTVSSSTLSVSSARPKHRSGSSSRLSRAHSSASSDDDTWGSQYSESDASARSSARKPRSRASSFRASSPPRQTRPRSGTVNSQYSTRDSGNPFGYTNVPGPPQAPGYPPAPLNTGYGGGSYGHGMQSPVSPIASPQQFPGAFPGQSASSLKPSDTYGGPSPLPPPSPGIYAQQQPPYGSSPSPSPYPSSQFLPPPASSFSPSVQSPQPYTYGANASPLIPQAGPPGEGSGKIYPPGQAPPQHHNPDYYSEVLADSSTSQSLNHSLTETASGLPGSSPYATSGETVGDNLTIPGLGQLSLSTTPTPQPGGASPMLAPYQGTYQSISPLPSPTLKPTGGGLFSASGTLSLGGHAVTGSFSLGPPAHQKPSQTSSSESKSEHSHSQSRSHNHSHSASRSHSPLPPQTSSSSLMPHSARRVAPSHSRSRSRSRSESHVRSHSSSNHHRSPSRSRSRSRSGRSHSRSHSRSRGHKSHRRRHRSSSTASYSSRSRSRSHSRSRAPPYDPLPDAKLLLSTLRSNFRVSPKPLIEVLPTLTPSQLYSLKATYKQLFRQVSLSKHIKSLFPTSTPFGKILFAVSQGPLESEAWFANSWYQKRETRNELLIEALMGKHNSEILGIKAAFKDAKYESSLEKAVQAELPSNKFRIAVMAQLAVQRMEESEPVTEQGIRADVAKLGSILNRSTVRVGGGGNVGGETEMIGILVNRSDRWLRALVEYYWEVYEKDLAKAIIDHSRNLVGETLLHIIHGATAKPLRDAKLLEQAITAVREQNREDLLISRTTRIHWEPRHLEEVKYVFRKKYHVDLGTRIREVASGEFGTFLVRMMRE